MSDEPDGTEEKRTVFMPPRPPGAVATEPPAPPASLPPASVPPVSAPPESSASVFRPVPPSGQGQVEVGSVLNNIFQVTRFIARGGMGEVFEGINVNSDERVAIKVMLPALAADPNVQAMFRKEAKTLTKLSHPALVQYRVLAQEPALGVLYIVTDFIEGENLSDLLGKVHPTSQELRSLMRCLCEGLRAAHELGAVHRDLSPDNVILQDNRIDKAKVIDFGIAKDLDASKGTIVGDGFAGKLGYVAPEQFGDYDRSVGPWTDVYSLGLVILAVAQGRNVDMGATLVEAIDKRRAGPDLSAIPDDLRPVLERMLKPNPLDRFRSMGEVLDALDGPRTLVEPAPLVDVAPMTSAERLPSTPPHAPPAKKKGPPLALIGGGVVAVLAVIGVVVMMGGKKDANPAAGGAPATAASHTDTAQGAIRAALPNIGCTWLDLTSVSDRGAGGLAAKLAGVAGSPAGAQAAVSKAASDAGAPIADVDLEDVAPVDQPVCPAIDAFRLIRATATGARGLSSPQRKFEMVKQVNGKLAARAVVDMSIGDPSTDFALFGLEPTGKIDAIIPSRTFFAGLPKTGQEIADLGGDKYRLQIDTDHQGWSGLLLLTGKGPFDSKMIAAPAASRGADWPQRFKAAADAGGWKAEMVWYKTVDEAPG